MKARLVQSQQQQHQAMLAMPPTPPSSPELAPYALHYNNSSSNRTKEFYWLHQQALLQDHFTRCLWTQLLNVGSGLLAATPAPITSHIHQHQPPYKMRKMDDSAKKSSPQPAPFSSSSSAAALATSSISFRPHALMDEQEMRRRCHDFQQHQTYVDLSGRRKRSYPDSSRRTTVIKAPMSLASYPKKYASSKQTTSRTDVATSLVSAEKGRSNINSKLNQYCLLRVFDFLDIQSKGRAAQVCRKWRDLTYEKAQWKGVETRLHLLKRSNSLYPSLGRRGIKKAQVLSLNKSFKELTVGLPHLQELNLSGCYNLTDLNLRASLSRELPSLRRLNLSLCKDVSDVSLEHIARRCPNLESLFLGGCTKISNAGLKSVSQLRRLKELDLRSCRSISDDGFRSVAAGGRFSQLETLGLQDCQRITDEGIGHICKAMKGLQRLNLSFCISVTDTGLKSVATLPNLQELNLRSCDNISDIGVGYLASDAGGHGLRQLDTSFCPNVTNTSAFHVAAGMPALRSLSMAGCSLGDDGLLRLAKELRGLELLNIGQCRKVTDASLKVVAKEMSGCLQRIDLYGCPQVSAGVLDLVAQMPKIKHLNRKLYLAANAGSGNNNLVRK